MVVTGVTVLGFFYFFGAKIVAMALRSILREIRATDTLSDSYLALATRQDLNYAVESNAIKDVLVQSLVSALKHESLKIGLKDLLVEGLQNQEVSEAAISGVAGGVCGNISKLNPFAARKNND